MAAQVDCNGSDSPATGEDLETIDVHANHLTGVNKSLLQTMLRQTIQVLLIVLVIGSAIIFIIHRISQKHIDEFIEGEVSFDDLTGLYNRKYFYDAAEEMIAEYKDKGGVSIIRINLCNFKVSMTCMAWTRVTNFCVMLRGN